MKTIKQTVPKVGQTMIVHGQEATIIRVYRLGTVDVETKSGRYFRVTGLPFLKP